MNCNSIFYDLANAVRKITGTNQSIQGINLKDEFDKAFSLYGEQSITSLLELNYHYLSFPQVSKIGYGVFSGYQGSSNESLYSTTLDSLYFPNCKKIENNNFGYLNLNCDLNNCFPKVKEIGASCFCFSKILKDNIDICFPLCENTGNSCFTSAYYGDTSIFNIKTLSFPNLITMGDYNFNNIHCEEYNFNKCENIGSSCFTRFDTASHTLDLPQCKHIGGNILINSPITTLKLKAIKSIITSQSIIGEGCFIQKLILPECSIISGPAFNGLSSLTSVDMPNLEYIGNPYSTFSFGGFTNCRFILELSFPKCSYIGSYAFRSCTSLETIVLSPDLYNVGSGAFQNCYLLSNINYGKCSSVYYQVFANCSNLRSIDLSYCTDAIYPWAFTGCQKLSAIYLSNYCALASVDVFANTPISQSNLISGYGSIYVPYSLLNSYRQAPCWTVYKNRIIGYGEIENYEDVIAEDYTDIEMNLDNKTQVIKEQRMFIVEDWEKNYSNVNITFETESENINLSYSIDEEKEIYKIIINAIDEGDFHFSYTITHKEMVITKTASGHISKVVNKYSISNPTSGYSFSLNSQGYYESTNKKVQSSYAYAKINFVTTTGYIYLDCINYAEGTYDFGIISNLDTSLNASNSTDSSSWIFKSFSGEQSPSVKTIAIPVSNTNEHYITIKYKKDGSVDSNNDSLQFKVRFE